MSSEQIGTAIAGVGLLVNVVVLVFLLFQVRLLREQVLQAKNAFVHEQERARSQATLEFLTATMERRHSLYGLMPSETEPDKVQEFLRRAPSDPAVDNQLSDYLNYYEMLACGVNSGVFDIDLVNMVSGSVIVKVADTYRAYIIGRQGARNHPTVYQELLKLAEVIRKQRGLGPA